MKGNQHRVQGWVLRRKPLLHIREPRAVASPEANALKDAIHQTDAVLFVTPEYNRSIPGAPKNAIDWASRPWGHNSFDHIPAAVIGASIGQIGTALAQQSLRAANAPRTQ